MRLKKIFKCMILTGLEHRTFRSRNMWWSWPLCQRCFDKEMYYLFSISVWHSDFRWFKKKNNISALVTGVWTSNRNCLISESSLPLFFAPDVYQSEFLTSGDWKRPPELQFWCGDIDKKQSFFGYGAPSVIQKLCQLSGILIMSGSNTRSFIKRLTLNIKSYLKYKASKTYPGKLILKINIILLIFIFGFLVPELCR